jgi:hypothetical protein
MTSSIVRATIICCFGVVYGRKYTSLKLEKGNRKVETFPA